jgi:cell division protein FtsI (penicillin-binding protein 3)
LSVADGLKKSSNILAAKVALRLGDERLHRYLQAFNVGSRLGIDLPGEEAGILHPVSRWSKISATRLAIGQGVAVTSLQMLGILSTIANDGYLMRPYVVRQVVGRDGTVLVHNEPRILGQPISEETAATMRWLLARVTEDGGTGRRARVGGYQVAGKTGTAQKPVAGGYSSSDYVASFAGFLPAVAPEIAVIVVVDEPQPRHTGGYVAGPAFSVIAEQTVRYLDIPPAEYDVALAVPGTVGEEPVQTR